MLQVHLIYVVVNTCALIFFAQTSFTYHAFSCSKHWHCHS